MSLKDRFANHSENAAEQPQPEEQKTVELYDTPGHTRNICFVKINGDRLTLNYRDLLSREYKIEPQKITLKFTTLIVILKGQNIEKIYEYILEERMKLIKETEERYLQLNSEQQTFISEIAITKS
jgi:hypothetical protein